MTVLNLGKWAGLAANERPGATSIHEYLCVDICIHARYYAAIGQTSTKRIEEDEAISFFPARYGEPLSVAREKPRDADTEGFRRIALSGGACRAARDARRVTRRTLAGNVREPRG